LRNQRPRQLTNPIGQRAKLYPAEQKKSSYYPRKSESKRSQTSTLASEQTESVGIETSSNCNQEAARAKASPMTRREIESAAKRQLLRKCK
jgi:hypothetical protein